jgi:hypothetical protein
LAQATELQEIGALQQRKVPPNTWWCKTVRREK